MSGNQRLPWISHPATIFLKPVLCFVVWLTLFFKSIFTGYRDDSLETVKRNEQQYGIPLKIMSYEELYGWTMDRIVEKVRNLLDSVCGQEVTYLYIFHYISSRYQFSRCFILVKCVFCLLIFYCCNKNYFLIFYFRYYSCMYLNIYLSMHICMLLFSFIFIYLCIWNNCSTYFVIVLDMQNVRKKLSLACWKIQNNQHPSYWFC